MFGLRAGTHGSKHTALRRALTCPSVCEQSLEQALLTYNVPLALAGVLLQIDAFIRCVVVTPISILVQHSPEQTVTSCHNPAYLKKGCDGPAR